MDMSDLEWHSILDFASRSGRLQPNLGKPEPPVQTDTVALSSPLPTPSVRSKDRQLTLSPILLTPLARYQGSHEEFGTETRILSVSTAFFPSANHERSAAPDLILISSDEVLFYVHQEVLGKVSGNRFDMVHGTIATAAKLSTLTVPESSAVLNVVLHTIYAKPFIQYSPSFDILNAAVFSLKSYGVPLKPHIAPSTPLFTALLLQAPLCPIEVYALASHHDLHDLAVQTSAHLLSFPLFSITEEQTSSIGAVYLKRLFLLHLRLVDTLKGLLLPPPHPHPPTTECGFLEQKTLTRAWALASAYLAWDATPDLSVGQLQTTLGALQDHLPCPLCRQALMDGIKHLTVQWSLVKRTI